jgi:hypothetical protein
VFPTSYIRANCAAYLILLDLIILLTNINVCHLGFESHFGNLLSGSGYAKRRLLCVNFTVVGETWKATGQGNSRVNIQSSRCMP